MVKKFLTRAGIFLLPWIITVVSINYLVDPANLFRKAYEAEVAEILISNNNVTNISNYDERIVQKELISKIHFSPEIVVIGSSRSMMISSDLFPENSFFNFSVSGASIEDLIGLYQMLKEKLIKPQKIILGVDPWIFNDENGQTRWNSISEYYYRFLDQEPKFKLKSNKLIELISLSYFKSAIKYLPTFINKSSNPEKTRKKFNPTLTKLADGSIIYGEKKREIDREGLTKLQNSYTKGEIYSLKNFKNISAKNWKEFKELAREIQGEGINVEIFLPPYPPIVYDEIIDRYPIVMECEKRIREFSELTEIKILGSYNPDSLKLNNYDFYDGMHCREETIKNLIFGQNK